MSEIYELNSGNADGNPISNLHEVQRANFKPAPTERETTLPMTPHYSTV